MGKIKDNMDFTRQVVLTAIDRERDYQDKKWGGRSNDEKLTLEDWLNLLEEKLCMARGASRMEEQEIALEEIRKISAIGVACLEYQGCPVRR